MDLISATPEDFDEDEESVETRQSIARITKAIDQLESSFSDAAERINRLKVARTELELGALFARAQTYVDSTIANAEEQATRIVATAQAEAGQVTAAAAAELATGPSHEDERRQILEEANSQSDAVLSQAKDEAAKLVLSAKGESEQLLDDARRQATLVNTQAGTEAGKVLADAQAEAARLVASAREESERLLSGAREEAVTQTAAFQATMPSEEMVKELHKAVDEMISVNSELALEIERFRQVGPSLQPTQV